MAEVELHVVCKHCGAEVSPYITECPYCGHRLRKRAPKLETRGEELAPKPKRRLFRGRRPKSQDREQPLAWLADARPYGTIALLALTAIAYIAGQAGDLGVLDRVVVGPLDGEYWRLITTQFNYANLGYLLAVGIAVALFGTSLERRYGVLAPIVIFLGAGAVGAYVAVLADSFPALGGNGGALGLLAAWLVRDLRDRRAGEDTESDLLGVAVIAAVLALIPLADPTAEWLAGLGGAATGALAGLVLPRR